MTKTQKKKEPQNMNCKNFANFCVNFFEHIFFSSHLCLCASFSRSDYCTVPDHRLQGSSEPGLNGLGNLYIPTSSLAICFSVLDGSGRSAETCLDMERCACLQPAGFFSRRTHITPSTYVYTSFVSDLVLAKSVAVGKTPRQTSLFNHLLYWPHIAWARCHHYEIESTLRKNRVHHFRSVT